MKKEMQTEFNTYLKAMQKRMDMGQRKYGDNYNQKNLKQELLDEAIDLSNYAFLLYLKAKEYNENLS